MVTPPGSRAPNTRAYRAAIVSFVVAIAGGVLAAVGYWTNRSDRSARARPGDGAVGIGFGLVSWAKFLDLDEHVVQEREPLRLDAQSDEDLDGDARGDGGDGHPSSVAALALIGASFAALAVGFVGPIGSLGPTPKGERRHAAGRRARGS